MKSRWNYVESESYCDNFRILVKIGGYYLFAVDALIVRLKIRPVINIFNLWWVSKIIPRFTKMFEYWKFFRSSCSASKIVPYHEIWAHGPIPEPKNRIRHFQIWEWDKYPSKLFFWKKTGTIVITVQRSSTSPKAMDK